MKKVTGNALTVLGGILFSSLAMAQDAAAAAATPGKSGLVAIGASIAIGLATFGAATGQGRASSAALEGIARNPTSRDQVFMPMILALVFMEFQAFLGFAIAFLLM